MVYFDPLATKLPHLHPSGWSYCMCINHSCKWSFNADCKYQNIVKKDPFLKEGLLSVLKPKNNMLTIMLVYSKQDFSMHQYTQ